MSNTASPLAIGGFFVGALTLLIAGILIFGGQQLFKPKLQFVVYFDSSLNGLNVGAPVKMQGVKVGTVKELALHLSPEAKILKPVVIEIEPSAFVGVDDDLLSAMSAKTKRKTLEKMIDQGLRARLEIQSLLTGLLYIDLDLYPNAPLNLTGIDHRDLPELPSVPTRTDVLVGTFDRLIEELQELPLTEIVTDLAGSLSEIRHMLTADETRETRIALGQAVKETRDLMATINRRIGPLVLTIEDAAKEARTSAQSLRKEITPLLTATQETMVAAAAALDAAQESFDAVESSTGPDSRLDRALREVRDAARAVRSLSDYLERNPSALIYGKQ